MTEAGSIGGFLKATSEAIRGKYSAEPRHNASVGITVCSPSTLEVPDRFKWLQRYTMTTEAALALPEHSPYDHTIDLKDGSTPPPGVQSTHLTRRS